MEEIKLYDMHIQYEENVRAILKTLKEKYEEVEEEIKESVIDAMSSQLQGAYTSVLIDADGDISHGRGFNDVQGFLNTDCSVFAVGSIADYELIDDYVIPEGGLGSWQFLDEDEMLKFEKWVKENFTVEEYREFNWDFEEDDKEELLALENFLQDIYQDFLQEKLRDYNHDLFQDAKTKQLEYITEGEAYTLERQMQESLEYLEALVEKIDCLEEE